MRPIIIVGDTQQAHPQRAFLTALEAQYPEHEYWFLGDTLDSFTSEPLEQVQTLTRILELIEAGRARCVWSNHDAGYAFPHLNSWCSGWNFVTAHMVCAGPLAERMRKLIEPFIWEHNLLVTHAGISNLLLVHEGISMPNAMRHKGDTVFTRELLTEWFHDRASPYWWVGTARGGRNAFGGPLWCDWHDEFDPVEGLFQIVGHTHSRKGEIEFDGEVGGGAVNVDTLGHSRTEILLELANPEFPVFNRVAVKL